MRGSALPCAAREDRTPLHCPAQTPNAIPQAPNVRVMKAILLAAGDHARLDAANGSVPKLLLSPGDEALLARHLRQFAAAGIESVAIVVGADRELLADALAELGLQDDPAGRLAATATLSVLDHPGQGSVVAASRLRDWLGNAPFLVSCGDHWFENDPSALLQAHAGNPADVTLSIASILPGKTGRIETDRVGRIVRLLTLGRVEQMLDSIPGGRGVFEHSVLDRAEALLHGPPAVLMPQGLEPASLDLIGDLSILVLRQSGILFAYRMVGSFCDIDTVQDLQKVIAIAEAPEEVG